MELTDNTTTVFIGNEFLIMEMEKYAQVFESRRGKEILRKLIDKTEVMDVDEKFLRLCKSYFPKDQLIDIYHAATCLQEGAVLITNDRHFDRINAEKIIHIASCIISLKQLF